MIFNAMQVKKKQLRKKMEKREQYRLILVPRNTAVQTTTTELNTYSKTGFKGSSSDTCVQ